MGMILPKMFMNADVFNQNLSLWDVNSANSLTDMFDRSLMR